MPTSSAQPSLLGSRRAILLAAVVVVVAALAAYHNSFKVPFIFDDVPAIVENPTIRQLWPFWIPLSPPHDSGLPVSGRPLVNFSLALNYACGGTAVVGYHALNLTLHLLAGLTLLGVVRRTLLQPVLRARFGAAALPLALAVAVLWTVHPLQTEAVTYVVQRAESLVGLFYFLTLYCFIRAAERDPLLNSAKGDDLDGQLCRSGFMPDIPGKSVGDKPRPTVGSRHPVLGGPLVTYPGNPAQYAQDYLNSKSETRISKQRKNPNAEIISTSDVRTVSFRAFRFFCFGFRASSFGFPGEVFGSGFAGLGYTSPSGGSRGWQVLAVAACLLGMASKEVMVTAPLIVLLYDRTFVAGSFRDAWRRRWRLYVGLAATWLFLGYLMASTGNRGGTAGFGLGITWWEYALTQVRAIVHYLRLAFWPHPLVFDYGGAVLAKGFAEIAPSAAILGALLAGTVVALRRWPVIGFAGAWFFAILAPTSSVVPVADTMFEHRMYLPLVAVVALAVLGGFALAGRRSLIGFAALAVGLGWATVRRNEDYRSELALWSDTVAKRPENVRAHYTLGTVLFALGRPNEAIAEYEIALRLKPGSAEAHDDLGNALVRLGRAAEAVPHYEAALRLAPQSADAHNNLGNALQRLGRLGEARMHYEAALRVRPNSADAHNNLGNLLAQAGEFAEAERHYEAALQARPDLADAQANLGNVLAQAGRPAAALPHYEAALQLRPEYADAHFNFATALALLRRWPEAIAHYEAGLRLQPDNAMARENLARLRTLQAAEDNQK